MVSLICFIGMIVFISFLHTNGAILSPLDASVAKNPQHSLDDSLFEENQPVSTQPDRPLNKWPTPKRLTLRHVDGEGKKIGYGTDYSTFALLLASDYSEGHFMPLIDIRGHRFDNSLYGANIGVGFRYIPKEKSFCQILGFNVFYDYRQGNKGPYNQVGVGLEVLGKRWDLRANVYAPFGTTVRECKHVFDQYTGGYVAEHRDYELTNYGYNLEVGHLFFQSKDFLLYGAAGPYYLTREREHFKHELRGGEIRLRPQYKDYLALDLIVSHDSTFKTVFQVGIILYLPLYQISARNKRPCGFSDRQIYQPIERFEVMPLGRQNYWKWNW